MYIDRHILAVQVGFSGSAGWVPVGKAGWKRGLNASSENIAMVPIPMPIPYFLNFSKSLDSVPLGTVTKNTVIPLPPISTIEEGALVGFLPKLHLSGDSRTSRTKSAYSSVHYNNNKHLKGGFIENLPKFPLFLPWYKINRFQYIGEKIICA